MKNNDNGFTVFTGDFLKVNIADSIFYFKYDLDKDQKSVKEYICEMLPDMYYDSSFTCNITRVSGILIRENDENINEIFFDSSKKGYMREFINFIIKEINPNYINPYETLMNYFKNIPPKDDIAKKLIFEEDSSKNISANFKPNTFDQTDNRPVFDY